LTKHKMVAKYLIEPISDRSKLENLMRLELKKRGIAAILGRDYNKTLREKKSCALGPYHFYSLLFVQIKR